MEFKSYGIGKVIDKQTELDLRLEELKHLGYSIVPNTIEPDFLEKIRTHLDEVYERQEAKFGKKKLSEINELDLARCLLADDDFFVILATYPMVLETVEKILGHFFILHLQNGIINRPKKEHHQSSWHRDLPYQDFVISKPLSINAFWCIDDFSTETGGTILLPYSHKVDHLPSLDYIERHQLQLEAPAGSIVFFDSMLYHRAGYNRSNQVRRGINHVYVVPILKQQIDLPEVLCGKFKDDPKLANLLGYSSKTCKSVKEYRNQRWERKYG